MRGAPRVCRMSAPERGAQMPAARTPSPRLTFHPLTPERWGDLEALFGERGAYAGCWCMWWRVARSEFDRLGNSGRKRAFKKIVDAGTPPGVLAYADGEPAAWCAVAPREMHPSLERSRTLRRVDDEPVWSVVCFFVAKPHRGRGITVPLIRAAVEHARRHGARIVEAYPIEAKGTASPVSSYMGLASAFRKAGFVDVVRSAGARRIMRRIVS